METPAFHKAVDACEELKRKYPTHTNPNPVTVTTTPTGQEETIERTIPILYITGHPAKGKTAVANALGAKYGPDAVCVVDEPPENGEMLRKLCEITPTICYVIAVNRVPTEMMLPIDVNLCVDN